MWRRTSSSRSFSRFLQRKRTFTASILLIVSILAVPARGFRRESVQIRAGKSRSEKRRARAHARARGTTVRALANALQNGQAWTNADTATRRQPGNGSCSTEFCNGFFFSF